MSLDAAKLEKVRELAGGIVQARCPACAEGGGDRKGEHLRIYPDGRYGCCVHPKDGQHRKRIFALAGARKAGALTLRLKTPPALPAVRSVKAALATFSSGTLGTPKTESENAVPGVPTPPSPGFGTPGTPILESRACAREDSPNVRTPAYTCKDLESGVPSVPRPSQAATDVAAEPPPVAGERLPFLTADGTLRIPFDSPERYHWWKPPHDQRLRVKQILAEVKERMKHAATV